MPTSQAATILVVDDEEAVRALLRRQLTAMGHSVLEAANGLEALHMVRVLSSKIEVVLADAVMPLMNGIELAATLLDEHPGLPVILVSACTPAALTRVGVHQTVVPVMMKPFEIDELEELIQVALESAADREATITVSN